MRLDAGDSASLGFDASYPETELLGTTFARGTLPSMPGASTAPVGGFSDDDAAHAGSDVDGDPDDMMAAFLPPPTE